MPGRDCWDVLELGYILALSWLRGGGCGSTKSELKPCARIAFGALYSTSCLLPGFLKCYWVTGLFTCNQLKCIEQSWGKNWCACCHSPGRLLAQKAILMDNPKMPGTLFGSWKCFGFLKARLGAWAVTRFPLLFSSAPDPYCSPRDLLPSLSPLLPSPWHVLWTRLCPSKIHVPKPLTPNVTLFEDRLLRDN